MVQLGLIAVATLLCAAAPVRSVHRGEVVTSPQVDWIVKAENSICGLSQSRQLRKPAKVRFDDLLALTPEKKKLDRERIDPNSAKGLRLMNDARNRVRDACSKTMKDQGYDSVWKQIKSRKGARVADVTASVAIEIGKLP